MIRLIHSLPPFTQSVFAATFLQIESPDAFLVSPADSIEYLLLFQDSQPVVEGMHFNLYNNLWGTSFPQWYSDDALFRFALNFGP